MKISLILNKQGNLIHNTLRKIHTLGNNQIFQKVATKSTFLTIQANNSNKILHPGKIIWWLKTFPVRFIPYIFHPFLFFMTICFYFALLLLLRL